MWILGSPLFDFAFLLLPGAAAFCVAKAVSGHGSLTTAFLFVSMALLDSGHIYTTILRTYANPRELNSNRPYYTGVLLGSLALLFGWYAFRLPYFWSFIVYFNVYHLIRQYHGLGRWYQKLNGRNSPATRFFTYALPAAPFLLFHFRPDAVGGYYTGEELFLYRNALLYYAGLVGYAGLVAAWIGYEIWLAAVRKIWEPSRFFSVLAASTTYGLAFLFGNNVAEVLGPLQVSHAVAYFALMALSLRRTMPHFYTSAAKAAAIVVGVAFLTGGFEGGVIESYVDFQARYTQLPPDLFLAAVYGLLLTPSLAHFIIDARIWTGKHREAKLVYASPEKAAPPPVAEAKVRSA